MGTIWPRAVLYLIKGTPYLIQEHISIIVYDVPKIMNGGCQNMVREATRDKLIVIAAVIFWITTILNVLELVIEGSSIINWITTILFLALAVYYTSLAVTNRT